MTTDQHGIPLFLQTFSGNESDEKTLLTNITQLTKNLRHPGKVYHIADAAFYTAETLATPAPPYLLDQPGADDPERDERIVSPQTSPTAVRGQPLPVCGAYSGVCRHPLEVGYLPLGRRCRSGGRRRFRDDGRTTGRRQRCHCENSEYESSPASRMPGSLPGSGCRRTHNSASPHLRSGR